MLLLRNKRRLMWVRICLAITNSLFAVSLGRASDLPSSVAISVNSGVWAYTVYNHEPEGNSDWITTFTLSVDAPILVTSSPANWAYATDGISFVSWFNTDLDAPYPDDIAPGSSLGGFDITSTGSVSVSDTYYLASWNHDQQISGPFVSDEVAVPGVASVPEPSRFGMILIAIVTFCFRIVRLENRPLKACFLVVASSFSSQAQSVIFDTTAPITSCCSFTIVGNYAENNGSIHNSGVAVPFTPDANYSLDTVIIDVVANYGAGIETTGMTLSLAADSGGLPGSTLETFTVGPFQQTGYERSVVLTSSEHSLLLANKQYWLVGTAGGNAGLGWILSSTFNGGFTFATNTDRLGWVLSPEYPFAAPPEIQVMGFPVSTTSPPGHMSFDDSDSTPLVQPIFTSTAHVTDGTLLANVELENNTFVWLGISKIQYASPIDNNALVLAPDPNAGVQGQIARFNVIPPCSSNLAHVFVGCASPGYSSWQAAFGYPGTISVSVLVTPLSASLTLLDLFLPSGISPDTEASIANQLYNTVPAFRTGADCLVNFTSKATALGCLQQSFLMLARNASQRSLVLAILLSEYIDERDQDLFEALLGVAPNVLEALGSVYDLMIKTYSSHDLVIKINASGTGACQVLCEQPPL